MIEIKEMIPHTWDMTFECFLPEVLSKTEVISCFKSNAHGCLYPFQILLGGK